MQVKILDVLSTYYVTTYWGGLRVCAANVERCKPRVTVERLTSEFNLSAGSLVQIPSSGRTFVHRCECVGTSLDKQPYLP